MKGKDDTRGIPAMAEFQRQAVLAPYRKGGQLAHIDDRALFPIALEIERLKEWLTPKQRVALAGLSASHRSPPKDLLREAVDDLLKKHKRG